VNQRTAPSPSNGEPFNSITDSRIELADWMTIHDRLLYPVSVGQVVRINGAYYGVTEVKADGTLCLWNGK